MSLIRDYNDNGSRINWSATFESTLFPRLYRTRQDLNTVRRENEALYQSDKVRVLELSDVDMSGGTVNIDGTLVIKGSYVMIANNQMTSKATKDIPAISAYGAKHLTISSNYIQGIKAELETA